MRFEKRFFVLMHDEIIQYSNSVVYNVLFALFIAYLSKQMRC